MTSNLFGGHLPVELSETDKRALGNYNQLQLLAMLLANTSAANAGRTIAVPLTLDISGAYAAGDVLADTQEIAGLLRNVGGSAMLRSITLLDFDDQAAAAIDLVFFSANVSLGTENAAPSITDGNAASILGVVNIPSANFVDLGGMKSATVPNIGLLLAAPAGTSIFMAAIARGTPTQTVNGITVVLGVTY